MWLCIPVSMLFHDHELVPLGVSGLISVTIGGLAMLATRKAPKVLNARDGFLIVAIGWILFSFFGSMPFILSGEIPSFTDAFFETISGFTTTGASILNEIEILPHGLLFWRSLTQWLGGMGIIVMSLAILPLLGVGGMQLFVAEVPGPTPDKLHPRIKETAKRLWAIYIIFTFAETLLLWIGGMTLFDAVNHSFTTMATGGYSTKTASLAYWDSPFIHYVIVIFMFLAGTNFTLSYFAMHLRFKKVWQNEEFRYYLGFILGFTILLTIILSFTELQSGEESFRHSLFQVVSIITTTGFVTFDYLSWIPLLGIILFMMMFFGGSAGSTGGGIKILRIVLLLKNSAMELKRLIHPNAVIPVWFNKSAVSPDILNNVFAFISFYIITVIVGVIVMTAMGYDIGSAFGAVAATLGNIGPGIGLVGPVENYAHIPVFGKWFLSFLMLIGRLELFTVLILFSPSFWKK
ncbi:MAG TPA: TrkH family potassium uptake protein [Bacteroides sp.]|nr:TrkH family potassium uptake protein [Bacteroides sp.]